MTALRHIRAKIWRSISGLKNTSTLCDEEADTEAWVSVGAARPLILQVPACLWAIPDSPFLLHYLSMVEKDRVVDNRVRTGELDLISDRLPRSRLAFTQTGFINDEMVQSLMSQQQCALFLFFIWIARSLYISSSLPKQPFNVCNHSLTMTCCVLDVRVWIKLQASLTQSIKWGLFGSLSA